LIYNKAAILNEGQGCQTQFWKGIMCTAAKFGSEEKI